MQASDTLNISLSLVTDLIVEQFPQWAHLPISPVALSGWDNRTFRLGSEMSIRLPSASCYAAKVPIEHKWLPILTPHLSFRIPKPIAMGKPSQAYPFNWSIYQWIDGESANMRDLDEVQLKPIALQLAQFLNELYAIDSTGGPIPGPHNFYRGTSPLVYDAETRAAITQLKDSIDIEAVTVVWEEAISSQWAKKPVWFHGDFSAGNILLKDNQLVGVIDFGGMGVGDPACDLVIAWTFLQKESRNLFKSHVQIDADTWARARGWALWKALITMYRYNDKKNSEIDKQMRIIGTILEEHKIKNEMK